MQAKELIEKDPRVEKLAVLSPNPVEPVPPARLGEEIGRALDNPVGAPGLSDMVKENTRVAVCISDRTRIFPKNEMIEEVLKRISPPVNKEDITFIVAGGNHAPSTPREAGIKEELLPAYRWISHRSTGKHNVYAGRTTGRLGGHLGRFLMEETARGLRDLPADIFKALWYPLSGNPHRLRYHLGAGFVGRMGLVAKAAFPTKVYINQVVKEADLVIPIGQVKPHYFAGYSGGAKSILPAVSSRGTIASNHFMRPHPAATLGVIKGNPIRADMEDAARCVGNVHLLNCVLDGEGQPYRFFAGNLVEAHRRAARAALEVGGVKTVKADMVVAFAKPPLSANVYQFSKAIAPAIRIVKPGGVIIAVGDCAEGIGGRFIVNEIIFKLGLQPRTPRGVDLFLISRMPDKEVLTTFFNPLRSLEKGLEFTAKKLKRRFSVALITEAGSMVPYLDGEDPADWI